jgi:hypothetical protein
MKRRPDAINRGAATRIKGKYVDAVMSAPSVI